MLEGMALSGQIVEQSAKAEQTLLASMVANRGAQFAKPAKPTQHVGIATELRQSTDLGESSPQIANEVAGHVFILDHGEGLQGQSESLDLRFEYLFESLPAWTHGIGGDDGNRDRLATARLYSRQTSAGASWT